MRPGQPIVRPGRVEGLWGVAACAETARRIGQARWEMLRLVYEQGLTQREVARRLKLRDAVVRRDIARSLRVMAEVVSGWRPS